MEVGKVSQESLKKAMETLGLIEKAEAVEAVAVTETVVKEEDAKSEELKKAEEAVALAQAKLDAIKNPKVEVKKEEIVKAEIIAPLNDELIKGFNDKIGAIATLVQAKDEKIEELTKAVAEVTGFNKALAAKIGMIEKTPLDRKSVATQTYVEKFEKAEGAKEKGAEIKVMSISNGKHRAEIAEELYKAATVNPEKIDEELSKAVSAVELRQIDAKLQQRLLKDFKIQVVR